MKKDPMQTTMVVKSNIPFSSSGKFFSNIDDSFEFISMTPFEYVHKILEEGIYKLKTQKFVSNIDKILNDFSNVILSNIFEIILIHKYETYISLKDTKYLKIHFFINKHKSDLQEFKHEIKIETNIDEILSYFKTTEYCIENIKNAYDELWNTPFSYFKSQLSNLEKDLKYYYKTLINDITNK